MRSVPSQGLISPDTSGSVFSLLPQLELDNQPLHGEPGGLDVVILDGRVDGRPGSQIN